MNVESASDEGVCTPDTEPPALLELVSVPVHWQKVHKQTVLTSRVQAEHVRSNRWKHSPISQFIYGLF